jgi:hypothetical protein
MEDTQEFAGSDLPARTVETADGIEYVLDVGPTDEASAEVVDDTVIVIADGEQQEFDAPAGDSEAFIHNGVLTIRTEVSA